MVGSLRGPGYSSVFLLDGRKYLRGGGGQGPGTLLHGPGQVQMAICSAWVGWAQGHPVRKPCHGFLEFHLGKSPAHGGKETCWKPPRGVLRMSPVLGSTLYPFPLLSFPSLLVLSLSLKESKPGTDPSTTVRACTRRTREQAPGHTRNSCSDRSQVPENGTQLFRFVLGFWV